MIDTVLNNQQDHLLIHCTFNIRLFFEYSSKNVNLLVKTAVHTNLQSVENVSRRVLRFHNVQRKPLLLYSYLLKVLCALNADAILRFLIIILLLFEY